MQGDVILFYACFLAAYCIIGIEMCGPNEFECKNGNCIDITLKCNDEFNCPDTSDEENCSPPGPCPEGLSRCPNGICVNLNTVNCTEITTQQSTLDTSSFSNESSISTQVYQSSYASDSTKTNDVTSSAKTVSSTEVTTPSNGHTDVRTIPTSPKAGIIPDEDDNNNGDIAAAVIVPVIIVIILICVAVYCRYSKDPKGLGIITWIQKKRSASPKKTRESTAVFTQKV